MVQLPIQSLAALPPNHDIRHFVRQILFLAAESVDRHRTPLLMSQKIVQLLYKTPSQLGRESMLHCLTNYATLSRTSRRKQLPGFFMQKMK